VELYESPQTETTTGISSDPNIGEWTAEAIRHIFPRPEMYVGSRSEPVALESVLWMTHRIWSEATGRQTDLFSAIEAIGAEEGGGAENFVGRCRQRSPQPTDEQTTEYVLSCWRRISSRLGILT
jgi:hypothetical protein